MRIDASELRAFALESRSRFEAELKSLVEIPSVSADPAKLGEVWRCAELAKNILRSHGVHAEILDTPGAPLVVGTLSSDPAHPMITVYNHLDVQPANEPEWRTDPFKLVIDGDRYLGRGTTDDKGPALTALLGAVAANKAGVPMNVRFLWELEEEIGSPSFEAGLIRHHEKLKTDAIVVSDTIWLTRGRPTTPAGLRGLQGFRLTLETASHDLHSGLVGGAARNPLAELCSLIDEMVDGRTGDVRIPGFYDEVDELTLAEARDFAACGFRIETFMRDHQIKSLRTDDPLDVMARIWARPTLEVHGLVGGYTGPGIKSAVPARAEAKLSCRLVPRMSAEKTFERIKAFIVERSPDVTIHEGPRLEPYKGKTSGVLAEALRAAYEFGFGVRAAFTREGGSIGAVPTMERLLGAPVYFLGLSLPEHGYHAPNENYDFEQALGGVLAFAKYFELAAETFKPAAQPTED
ncbi:MAG: M20/M25/M40 family metallo-hydrolase [Deltaproteobacteria bacterium]|nr:M20/M25/M40 family metallo-hydrolase [Deltaproteobacteria bacterium]